MTGTLIAEISKKQKKSDSKYNLFEIYELAYKNNNRFQAEVARFQAQEKSIPISLGALLPSVTATYNYAENYSNPAVFTESKEYRTFGPELNASQILFDWSAWKTYTASQYTLKANAIVLAQAQQKLMTNTVAHYFSVLRNKELLKVSLASLKWNKKLFHQTEKKYNAHLASITDWQSAKANYEQAKAQVAHDKSKLKTAILNLKRLTTIKIEAIENLKPNIPLIIPKPKDPEAWAQLANKGNLKVVQNEFLLQVAKEHISMAWGEFLPTLAAVGSLSKITSFQNLEPLQPTTSSVGIKASWSLINGGSDYATLEEKELMSEQAKFTLEQSKLTAESTIQEIYFNIETDIEMIKAFRSAIKAGRYAVKTMKSQYEVGTSTIVDLLNQQHKYVKSQYQLTETIYQYINNLISLKKQAGILTLEDVKKINAWLEKS